MSYTANDKLDVDISQVTGLETYKGLYYFYPNLYTYISDPLQPTEYYKDLVSQVIVNTGFTFDEAGIQIRNNLEAIAEGKEPNNYRMVEPLINSSYSVKYMNNTFTENAILVTVVIILSFWVIWYLYKVQFFDYLFNIKDGITCYNCPSIFDKI